MVNRYCFCHWLRFSLQKNHIFSLCSFRDALTIKDINDSHINYVENFIKTLLPGIVANWKTRGNATPINDEDFFGPIYVFDPSTFEFTPGDILQINQIVDYVKKNYSDPNIGPQHFVPDRGNQKVKLNYKSTGRYFGKLIACEKPRNNVAHDINCDDLKHSLYKNAFNTLKKKGVSNRSLELFNQAWFQ